MHASPLRLPVIIPGPQTEGGPVRHSPQGEGGLALDNLAGRLVEISGERSSAQLTAAFGLVLEAQLCGDRAAWVTFEHSTFFPPDAAAGGVDAESLPVVRITTAAAAARAAEHLVRSGGFGLVVIDLSSAADVARGACTADVARGASAAGAARGAKSQTLPVPMLTRLLGLARTHHAAVLVLTRKSPDVPSLNSLISLRAEAQRSAREGGYDVRVRVLKDKRRAPGWDHVETCRGSAGLR